MALEEREAVDVGDSSDREIERPNAAGACLVRIGAATEKKLHDVGVAVAGSHHQSSEAIAGDAIDVRAAIEKRFDGFDLTFVDRMHQRRPVVLARDRVRIGAAPDQSANRRDVTSAGGVRKWREIVVELGAAPEKKDSQKSESSHSLSCQVLCDAKYRPAQILTSTSSFLDASHLRMSASGTVWTSIFSEPTPPPLPTRRTPSAR